ncbi:hypothetical protein IPF86_00560 [Candidatus Nomurabacteria bacterium]|jgi:hypothetical protein|nr:MAG: hypothetical protein IPF86_00560 [Candidatus Nomurabacteria bacterium]
MKKQFLKRNKGALLYFITVTLFITSFALPVTSYAVAIRASSNSALVAGDTSIIDIYLDTEGEQINSVDGSLTLSDTHNGNFEIKDLSVVNSVFTLWPRKPSLEEGNINFVGGLPGGVSGDKLLLFKVIVKINQPGDFTIKPSSVTAYLNDGLGTPSTVVKDISIISVRVANESNIDKWQEIISNDNIPPEAFTVEVLQDSYLYDGKKFLSFETTDGQSGISYYEVREGTNPGVRSGSHYVLINQTQDVDVTVLAYDKAGNFQTATVVSKEPINWVAIVVSVLIIICLYAFIKLILRWKYNAQTTL